MPSRVELSCYSQAQTICGPRFRAKAHLGSWTRAAWADRFSTNAARLMDAFFGTLSEPQVVALSEIMGLGVAAADEFVDRLEGRLAELKAA